MTNFKHTFKKWKSWVPRRCQFLPNLWRTMWNIKLCQPDFFDIFFANLFSPKSRLRHLMLSLFMNVSNVAFLWTVEGFLPQNIKREHLSNRPPFWELQGLWFCALAEENLISGKCNDCSFQNYCQLVYAKLKINFWCWLNDARFSQFAFKWQFCSTVEKTK